MNADELVETDAPGKVGGRCAACGGNVVDADVYGPCCGYPYECEDTYPARRCTGCGAERDL